MQPLQLVYRVECSICTFGPYNCRCEPWHSIQGRNLQAAHSTDFFLRDRPGMLEDFRPSKLSMHYYYSGFKSRKQLTNWFSMKELTIFKTGGFKLAMYIAEEWCEGSSKAQIFFVRPNTVKWRLQELIDA